MGFLTGKRILVTGLASNRSIAYGIAKAMKEQGAELAFTYLNDKLQPRVEEFAKEFDGKAEYDKEKNIIGINLKDSNILDGKKENTGKDTIQVNELQEKFKKLIQDMGLRTCRNASTIRISRNRCSNSSNCKIRKSVMYVVWK